MTGYWVDQDNGEEVQPTEDSVREIVVEWIDNDDDEFHEWVRDEWGSDIIDRFMWNGGCYMDDLYIDIKDRFIAYKTREILESYREEDFTLGTTEYHWNEGEDIRRVQVQAFGFVEYNADETTLDDYMKHNYPCLKDFTVVTRELPKE